MDEKSVNRLGGVCSIIVGILYVLIGVTFLLVPAEQQGGSGMEDIVRFLPSFNKNPTPMTLLYWEFALGAILAIAAVPAISGLVRTVNEGWTRWTSNLAFLGFAVVAIYYFQMMAIAPSRAAAYVAGDASTKAALAVTIGVDPQFLLRYGVIGLWIFVVNILALKGGRLPKVLSIVGIIAAVIYWLLAANDLLGVATILRPIIAVVGGIIAAPIWYIWVGFKVLKTTS
jgi:hypothetical protein